VVWHEVPSRFRRLYPLSTGCCSRRVFNHKSSFLTSFERAHRTLEPFLFLGHLFFFLITRTFLFDSKRTRWIVLPSFLVFLSSSHCSFSVRQGQAPALFSLGISLRGWSTASTPVECPLNLYPRIVLLSLALRHPALDHGAIMKVACDFLSYFHFSFGGDTRSQSVPLSS